MKNCLKTITIILIVVIMNCSCKTNYNIIGEYACVIKSKNLPSINYYLNIKSDSSFVYQYYFDHIIKSGKGNWNVKDKNQIVIRSDSVMNTTDYGFINSDTSFTCIYDTLVLRKKSLYWEKENVKMKKIKANEFN